MANLSNIVLSQESHEQVIAAQTDGSDRNQALEELLARCWTTASSLTTAFADNNSLARRLQIYLYSIRKRLSDGSKSVVLLVGQSGAGKSTLINSVIGQRILPTSPTRNIIEIHHWDEDVFYIRTEYISREAWRANLKNCIAMSAQDSDASKGPEQDMEDQVSHSRAVIEAVYPLLDLSTCSADQVDEYIDQEWLKGILGLKKELRARDAAKVHEELRRALDPESRSDEPRVPWPLIAKIQVHLNSRLLSRGIILVDLPSAESDSPAWGQIGDAYVKSVDHYLIISNVRRAVDSRFVTRWLRKIVDSASDSHKMINSTLVCTHIDQVEADLPRHPSTDELSHESWIQERFSATKVKLQRRFRDICSEKWGSEKASDDITIHFISSPAFLELKGISNGRVALGFSNCLMTGVPQLTEDLAKIASKRASQLYGRIIQSVTTALDGIDFCYSQDPAHGLEPAMRAMESIFNELQSRVKAETESVLANLETHLTGVCFMDFKSSLPALSKQWGPNVTEYFKRNSIVSPAGRRVSILTNRIRLERLLTCIAGPVESHLDPQWHLPMLDVYSRFADFVQRVQLMFSSTTEEIVVALNQLSPVQCARVIAAEMLRHSGRLMYASQSAQGVWLKGPYNIPSRIKGSIETFLTPIIAQCEADFSRDTVDTLKKAIKASIQREGGNLMDCLEAGLRAQIQSWTEQCRKELDDKLVHWIAKAPMSIQQAIIRQRKRSLAAQQTQGGYKAEKLLESVMKQLDL